MKGDIIRQREDGRWTVYRHGTSLSTGTSVDSLARRYPEAEIERDSESEPEE